jgi:hypothetical protein
MNIPVFKNIMLCRLATFCRSLLFLQELLNVACPPHYCDQIKAHEVGRTGSMHGGDEKYMHSSSSGNLKILILVIIAVGLKLLDCWGVTGSNPPEGVGVPVFCLLCVV